jgi:hypothetical protein
LHARSGVENSVVPHEPVAVAAVDREPDGGERHPVQVFLDRAALEFVGDARELGAVLDGGTGRESLPDLPFEPGGWVRRVWQNFLAEIRHLSDPPDRLPGELRGSVVLVVFSS